MKHEAQKSNHLTITQLLCEQISIIPNLSKWNLELLNRLENSVPQQQQGITSMRGWRREGEKTSMSAISGRVPKSMDHPPPKKNIPTPASLLHTTSNWVLLSKQRDEVYFLLLSTICSEMATYKKRSLVLTHVFSHYFHLPKNVLSSSLFFASRPLH